MTILRNEFPKYRLKMKWKLEIDVFEKRNVTHQGLNLLDTPRLYITVKLHFWAMVKYININISPAIAPNDEILILTYRLRIDKSEKYFNYVSCVVYNTHMHTKNPAIKGTFV